MSDKSAVVIIGELDQVGLSSTTAELLGRGRELADQISGSLDVILLGNGLEAATNEALARGADRAHTAQSDLLKQYQAAAWLQVLVPLIKNIGPETVLMGQTAIGRDLGPRLAFRLDTGIAMDCTALELDEATGLLRMSRPVYGCKAIAVSVCKSKPQMATIRSKTFSAGEPDPQRKGEQLSVPVEIDESQIKARVIEKIKEEAEGVPLEDANVVVSGGRGIGGQEGFELIEDLARLFNGATGASRPPCDSGWAPPAKQIGLTGKIIRPGLYIAVAISGSSQHMAGCADSGTIIAINKDPEAGIFSFAHYGVVGDYKSILPPLMEKLKEKL